MRSGFFQIVARVMIPIVIVNWSGLPSMAAAQKTPRQISPEQIADRLDKLFGALEAAQRDIPRDTFDPQAIIETVGKNPGKLFAWVRDKTYLVPYRGALRGPTGVLMDRLGNSLDRALLLHELVRRAGYEVRLARGPLLPQQATVVLDNARPIPEGGVPMPPHQSRREIRGSVERYARGYDLDPAALHKVFDRMTFRQQRLAEEAFGRTADQWATLAAAVSGPDRNAQQAESRTAAIQALQDHWWVEAMIGADWTALDPTLPGAKIGETLVESEWSGSVGQLRDLGPELIHFVKIRVFAEFWEKGDLKPSSVLEYDLVPAETFGERVVLSHGPPRWPQDFDPFNSEDPAADLKSAVLEQHEWLPILSVGDKKVYSYSFTDDGLVSDATLPGWAQAALAGRKVAQAIQEGAEDVGRSIGDILVGGQIGDTGLKRDSERKAEEDGGVPGAQLTAEWIEYEIHTPGQDPRTIRREIFDLLGSDIRTPGEAIKNVPAPRIAELESLNRALALLGRTEILPLASWLSPQFVEHVMTQNLLDNKEHLLGLIQDAESENFQQLSERMRELTPIPDELYALALARSGWSRYRESVYLDRPNILTYHTSFRQDMQRQFIQVESFDIVANDVAVHPKADADPFMIRLEQGVLDTNAEAVLASASCRGVQDRADCGDAVNTSELFALSGAQEIEWLVIKDAQDAAWQDVELPVDVQARIELDLNAGYTVLVPKRTVALGHRAAAGWWRIDPETGTALGIGENGWGQTTTEYIKMISAIALFLVSVATCAKLYRSLDSQSARALCIAAFICAFLPLALLLLLLFIPFAGLFLVVGFPIVVAAVAPAAVAGYLGVCAGIATLAGGAEAFGLP